MHALQLYLGYTYIYISVWENTNSHIQGSMIEMIYKETKK